MNGLVHAMKTGTMHILLKAIGPMKKWLKGTAMGTTFGAEAYASAPEGMKWDAVKKAFGTGAVYGWASRGGRYGINDAYKNYWQVRKDTAKKYRETLNKFKTKEQMETEAKKVQEKEALKQKKIANIRLDIQKKLSEGDVTGDKAKEIDPFKDIDKKTEAALKQESEPKKKPEPKPKMEDKKVKPLTKKEKEIDPFKDIDKKTEAALKPDKKLTKKAKRKS